MKKYYDEIKLDIISALCEKKVVYTLSYNERMKDKNYG